jgi:hypothetical protein
MLPALLWLAFLALPLAAWGLINPQFTPIHLVDQCDTILTARIKTKDIVNKVELEVSEALKGKAPAALVLDLSDAPKERADAARKQLLAAAGRPVLFFSADDTQTGYLHVQGTWLKLSGKGGAWRLEAVDQNMLSTWDGGTDMLTRCVQYILADRAAAAVPAEAGLRWRTIKKIGSVAGQARDIAAINVAGDGTCCLFVASDKGDRLLRPGKDGAFEDITEKVKLASRSRLATWGNFGGNGRLDLASYDGATLTIWTQAADGTFSPVKPGEKFELPEGCVGMATIAVGAGMGVRTPGLIFSPPSGLPVLLKPAGKYAFEAMKLPAPATAPKDYGKGQACLVADFNGDSLVDVIQPFEKGGLIYLGNKDGSFDAPKACAVCATVGGGKAALGDFDGDGLLDVLMAGAEGVKIFQNRGQGLFEEAIIASGEIGYKNLPLASGCGVCDFNNDTRQDIFVTYGAGPMLLYFNRGFRSFGQVPAREVALNQAPDIGQGQQLGLFADLGGGGTQDLFLVAQSGDIWCAFNYLGSESAALCVKARLRAGSPEVGPVNVSLWKEERCLGTAVVQAGLAPAFFGIETAGAYTLKWRFPGGREMSREVPVTNKPVTVELEGAK